MTTSPLIALDSADAADQERTGGKAARLAELVAAGFPVPHGVVIPIEIFERFVASLPMQSEEAVRTAPFPPALRMELEEGLAPWSARPVAVRSSAVAEDLPGASFAGQYESVLDVLGIPAILDAIRTCWSSALGPRLLAYRERQGLSGPPRIAVLVQEMVAADAAGVAFTADPLTGKRDEILVNAVRGRGERLVSGAATADQWRVGTDEAPKATTLTDRALTRAQVGEIAAMARRVADHYGVPQDIEWVIAGGRLHLVQARPITALPDDVDWTPPVPGLWLRTFRLGEWLGEPITPLFETWLLERMERRLFARFGAVLPIPMPPPYHVTVNGWYYTTANFVPRTIPAAVSTLLRHLVPAALRSPTSFSVLVPPFAHRGMEFFEREWRSGGRKAYDDAVRTGLARVDDASETELVELVDGLADLAGDELFYFFMVGGSAWKVETRLAAFHRRHLARRVEGNYQDLLQGLGDPTASAAHVALSLDWFHPTFGELGLADDPRGTQRRAETAARRDDAVRRARAALADSPARLRRFDALLERAQHFGKVREEQARHLTLAWPLLRRAVARLGRLTVEDGSAIADDAIYFFTRDELLNRARTAPARERRDGWERQRRMSAPVSVGRMSSLQRRVFGGHAASSGAGKLGLLHGAPASAGRATGRARIVLGVESFDQLEDGEILIAPATNPGWTPLFSRAAGVVTDTGSLMAHASLVAREYGIPAVVGTGKATRVLHDGDLVTVDGNTGVVERLS